MDINFYGMQSKVHNPMTSPDWKKAVRSKMTENMFENSMGQLKAEHKKL